jgi:hypothetical protein
MRKPEERAFAFRDAMLDSVVALCDGYLLSPSMFLDAQGNTSIVI